MPWVQPIYKDAPASLHFLKGSNDFEWPIGSQILQGYSGFVDFLTPPLSLL